MGLVAPKNTPSGETDWQLDDAELRVILAEPALVTPLSTKVEPHQEYSLWFAEHLAIVHHILREQKKEYSRNTKRSPPI